MFHCNIFYFVAYNKIKPIRMKTRIYRGKMLIELAKEDVLYNFHISDSYTKFVKHSGATVLLGICIKSGHVEAKSIFDRFWQKTEIEPDTVIWVYEHNNSFYNLDFKSVEDGMEFYSWELNKYDLEFSESGEILKINFTDEILHAFFNLGFEDALTNKQLKKFGGLMGEIYILGYNSCNRTNGDVVDANLIIKSRSLPKCSYSMIYEK